MTEYTNHQTYNSIKPMKKNEEPGKHWKRKTIRGLALPDIKIL